LDKENVVHVCNKIISSHKKNESLFCIDIAVETIPGIKGRREEVNNTLDIL
jgi:hypothetical protein